MAAKKPPQRTFEYEFGGPIGTSLTILFLPIVILALAHWSQLGRMDVLKDVFVSSLDMESLGQAFGMIVSWGFFQIALERILPGDYVEGAPIRRNQTTIRLKYRMNGHLAFWVTLLLFLTGWPSMISGRLQFTEFPYWGTLYRLFPELALATIILSTLLSIYLYVSSFGKDSNGKGKILATDSGNAIYDFFMGRELNPRILGDLDLKEFCELRPGLIGWMLLNMSCAYQQKQEIGYITYSMILINLFHGIYVWDALFQERAILTTMDITTDGFGFMLCFGDLAWVPFTYSIQARYLVSHDPHLELWQLSIILGIHILGYWIFRSANGQKDLYRRDPNHPDVAHLRYMPTQRGTRLLISGWWGMARKINYLGDYLMALAWCLVCGFGSIVPYYYAIYFAILLVHRSIRDDHMCHEKYGSDWIEYKKIVPYRFIPGIL